MYEYNLALDVREPDFVAKNKSSAVQADLGSLISTFVIHSLESTIAQLAPCIFSILLVFLAGQAVWAFLGQKPPRQVFSGCESDLIPTVKNCFPYIFPNLILECK